MFKTIDECKAFVSDYFETSVIDTKPRDMPMPDM